MKKNILILGAAGRNGIAAAGALKDKGYNLVGVIEIAKPKIGKIISKLTEPAVFDKIIYCQKNSSSDKYSLFCELKNIIINNNIDVILPTGTHYTLVVSEYKSQLSRLCAVPCDDFEKMNQLHDKFKAMQLCQSLGIPTPTTFLIKDESSLQMIKEKIKYPAVLKLRDRAANEGIWVVRNTDELQQIYMDNIVADEAHNRQFSDRLQPILQEFIPGELHDVTSFSIKGEPLSVLSQKRLMTIPLWGGGGIVNITTDNPDLRKHAKKIIEKIKWDGILEFDFKLDSRDGVAKLLEINPKIWGTTWLTVQAGFNMPLYLVKNALGESFEIPEQYKVGLCARWPLLEIKTWLDKPCSIEIFLKRVVHFFRLFTDKTIIYDTNLLGTKALLGSLLLSILSKCYRYVKIFKK